MLIQNERTADDAPIRNLVGAGVYTFSEASRYLRVPTRNLRRWALGYERPLVGQGTNRRTIFSAPVLATDVAYVEGEPILTFAELIELRFIALFRQYRISLPTIRAVSLRAARRFDSPHPFSIQKWMTDGKTIFTSQEREQLEKESLQLGATQEQIVEDMKNGQLVMAEIIPATLTDIDFPTGDAQRWWLMGRSERVVLDKERNFGRPTDNESGVPVHVLFSMVRAGESVERVAHWYKVSKEAVESAIRFESQYYQPSKKVA